jgi:hypothetical protein
LGNHLEHFGYFFCGGKINKNGFLGEFDVRLGVGVGSRYGLIMCI